MSDCWKWGGVRGDAYARLHVSTDNGTYHDALLPDVDGLERAEERVEEAGEERHAVEGERHHEDEREGGGGRDEEARRGNVELLRQLLELRWGCGAVCVVYRVG